MKIGELSKIVESELTSYAEKSTKVVKTAVKETAEEIKKNISSNAPVGTRGKYAKSWRVKKTGETDSSVSYIIHANKDGYRLSHLLEFGHAKRGGGRVGAKAHIKPAEEKGITSLEEKIRGGLD